MKTSLVSICLLVFHQGLLVGQEPEARDTNMRGVVFRPRRTTAAAYAADHKIGAAEADIELKEGRATIWAYGLRELGELLDRETGLPYKFVAGCVVNEEIEARTAGHNDTITKYIRERGLPRHSFKRWEKELFDLQGYQKSRLQTEKAHSLVLDGPVVKSADGKYTIRLVKSSTERADGSVRDTSSVVVSVAGVDREPSTNLWVAHQANVDFLWGPADSGFAVIRCQEKNGAVLLALDLHSGKLLREEFEVQEPLRRPLRRPAEERGDLKRLLPPRAGTERRHKPTASAPDLTKEYEWLMWPGGPPRR
jgi:hypothetical protein